MHFVSKRERKPKERGMYRSNNGWESTDFRSKHKGRRQNVFTISSDNTNKQSYNTVLSNYAKISTSLEIVCVAIERGLVLSQRTASSKVAGVAC